MLPIPQSSDPNTMLAWARQLVQALTSQQNLREVPIGALIPYVGQVSSYGFGINPDGWFPCDGRSLSKTSFPELFSVLGYSTDTALSEDLFSIPDLRDRLVLGVGPNYEAVLNASNSALNNPDFQNKQLNIVPVEVASSSGSTNDVYGIEFKSTTIAPPISELPIKDFIPYFATNWLIRAK